MKTWDDWSDFEISNKITELKNNRDMTRNIKIMGLWHRSCAYVAQGVKFVDIGGEFKWVPCANYCSDPSAMWSIILKNNIVVTPCMGANIGDATGYSEHQNHVISEFDDNSKALRAAAIVFLMMNGVNPE